MAIFFRRLRSSISFHSHTKNYTDPMHPNYRTSSPIFLRLFTATSYSISLVFLILVMLGNINSKVSPQPSSMTSSFAKAPPSQAVIRSTYFLTINLANTTPNAVLISSVARSIGLHDFYQVGLWNFCKGYNNQGITHCSTPKTLYWFDPVSIVLNEFLSGATIALSASIVSALKPVRIASH
jgi:SUR7/PalI family